MAQACRRGSVSHETRTANVTRILLKTVWITAAECSAFVCRAIARIRRFGLRRIGHSTDPDIDYARTGQHGA